MYLKKKNGKNQPIPQACLHFADEIGFFGRGLSQVFVIFAIDLSIVKQDHADLVPLPIEVYIDFFFYIKKNGLKAELI